MVWLKLVVKVKIDPNDAVSVRKLSLIIKKKYKEGGLTWIKNLNPGWHDEYLFFRWCLFSEGLWCPSPQTNQTPHVYWIICLEEFRVPHSGLKISAPEWETLSVFFFRFSFFLVMSTVLQLVSLLSYLCVGVERSRKSKLWTVRDKGKRDFLYVIKL